MIEEMSPRGGRGLSDDFDDDMDGEW